MNNDSGNFMHSVLGGTEASTEALQLRYYLEELKRQSEMASRSITRGWTRAVHPETPSNDAIVWGDLQSALFASIVVCRILQPVGVWKHQDRAEQRGAKLRQLLHIDGGSALFSVRKVRNSFEHFDERLDAAFVAKRASLIDWHISKDGVRLRTPEESQVPVGEALRQFFPGSGRLHFGEDGLDLFALDCALLELTSKAATLCDELAAQSEGPFTFGVFKSDVFDSPSSANARLRQWFRFRAEIGNPVQF